MQLIQVEFYFSLYLTLIYTVRMWRILNRNLQIIDMGVQFNGPCALRLPRCHWVLNVCMSKNNTQNRTQLAVQEAGTKATGCKQLMNKCVNITGRFQTHRSTWTADPFRILSFFWSPKKLKWTNTYFRGGLQCRNGLKRFSVLVKRGESKHLPFPALLFQNCAEATVWFFYVFSFSTVLTKHLDTCHLHQTWWSLPTTILNS